MTFRPWFAKPHTALRDVSLQVERGEVVCLLGPNGAGKSTLMKIACGLLWPTAGTARVGGRNPAEDPRARQAIGAVFESERWMIWQLTARENLEYFAALRGIPKPKSRNQIDDCLHTVGLTQAANKQVGEYSRGMKQRLALAGALLTDPDLLLLDEPTLGLDLEGQSLIRSLLTQFKGQRKGILLATHQLELAARYGDRIAFLREGRLIVDQPVQTLLERYAPAGFEIHAQGPNQTYVLTCSPDEAYPTIARLAAQGHTLIRAGQTVPDLEAIYQRIVREDAPCSGGPSQQPSSAAAG